MHKAFTKGLDEDDQEEGHLKRVENIKDKNKELLYAFSVVNKISKAGKNESTYNYDCEDAFHKFTETLKNLEEWHWAVNTTR